MNWISDINLVGELDTDVSGKGDQVDIQGKVKVRLNCQIDDGGTEITTNLTANLLSVPTLSQKRFAVDITSNLRYVLSHTIVKYIPQVPLAGSTDMQANRARLSAVLAEGCLNLKGQLIFKI